MSNGYTPVADSLIERNREYASTAHNGDLAVEPQLRVAVVACMDARLDVLRLLGLNNGDAHLIRNAGGVITDDVIRSLCLSQRALGTREIVLVHHTECGLQKTDEAQFRAELKDELGVEPSWALGTFDDPYDDVRWSIERLTTDPFVPHTDDVRGFVFDVETGLLIEA